ncbi:EutN/CcmL family microcompartment protein [Pseudobutyrivibrio xylanivorans]|uniref:Ethanolamine utilization protein EutN n=1 Tax=Pseudobutyrivibrio xylanivorans TaxID=185007 RepID=A0A5P6VPX3_PSEXY|nr:EutN/CcmL family microcompartment protein [Pseudobutyrivibrio xylanivorans]QFJ54617.1 ethanolamine utilization protein EutN [Pseudobutyrivibrio xylanivorans]
MILAKVIGNVVATRKDESLEGTKLMIVRRVDAEGNYIEPERVAVDYVGCGIGEFVLCATGSSTRVEENKRNKTIDMAVIGIIDSIDTSGA